MTAANVFQQTARSSDDLVTDPKLRRDDFLLRDEWMRRLATKGDAQDWFASIDMSEFTKRQMGNLREFDFVGEAKTQYEQCDGLLLALQDRLLKELTDGNN